MTSSVHRRSIVASARRAGALGLALALYLVAPAPARAEPNAGFLELDLPPGAEVLLDGRPSGAAPAGARMVLRDVPSGFHRVEVRREGFEPQHHAVIVEDAAVTRVAPRPWVTTTSPSGPTGALVVDVLPGPATIEARKLGWPKTEISGERFVASRVPAGTHRLTFCNADKCIDHRATIRAGEVTALVVDLEPARIRDAGPALAAHLAGSAQGCERAATPAEKRATCLDACRLHLVVRGGLSTPACDALTTSAAPLLAAGAPGEGTTPVASRRPDPSGHSTDLSGDGSGLGARPRASAEQAPCATQPELPDGYVTMTATPPAEVWLGERNLGPVPLSRVRLPAGCHELRLVSTAERGERRVRVHVEPNRVAIYRVDLSREPQED